MNTGKPGFIKEIPIDPNKEIKLIILLFKNVGCPVNKYSPQGLAGKKDYAAILKQFHGS